MLVPAPVHLLEGRRRPTDVVYVSALGGAAVLLLWQRDIMSDTSCINITTSSELDRPYPNDMVPAHLPLLSRKRNKFRIVVRTRQGLVYELAMEQKLFARDSNQISFRNVKVKDKSNVNSSHTLLL